MPTSLTGCRAGVVGIGLQKPSDCLTAAMVLIFTLFPALAQEQCLMQQENSLGLRHRILFL
jgi:hypothetical protein